MKKETKKQVDATVKSILSLLNPILEDIKPDGYSAPGEIKAQKGAK